MTPPFDDRLLDDPGALAEVDAELRAIASWGAQVRRAEAAARPALLRLDSGDRPRAVVAAGADGRLFRAVLEPVCPVPFVAWPHPGLPGWAGPLDLVVVMSTTGQPGADAAAVVVVAEAARRGCGLLVAAPEGSAVASAAGTGSGITVLPAGTDDPTALAVPVLLALHALGLGPELQAAPVADALDDVAVRCAPGRPVGQNPAKDLALALAEAVPVVWGGSVLAARAARRVAEALRRASGRPAVAGDEAQIVPLLRSTPEADIFADPYDTEPRVPRPCLVVLDDGADSPLLRAARERILAAADDRGVHVQTVTATDGPDVGRFASLLAVGRYTAVYLGIGLGGSRDSG